MIVFTVFFSTKPQLCAVQKRRGSKLCQRPGTFLQATDIDAFFYTDFELLIFKFNLAGFRQSKKSLPIRWIKLELSIALLELAAELCIVPKRPIPKNHLIKTYLCS